LKLITKFLRALVNLRFVAPLAAMILAGAVPCEALLIDRIAAKVGGEILTLSAVVERAQILSARMRRGGGGFAFKERTPEPFPGSID